MGRLARGLLLLLAWLAGGCASMVKEIGVKVTEAVGEAVEQGTRDAVPLSLACAYYREEHGTLPASFAELREFVETAAANPRQGPPALVHLAQDLRRFPDLIVLARGPDEITFAYPEPTAPGGNSLGRITVRLQPE